MIRFERSSGTWVVTYRWWIIASSILAVRIGLNDEQSVELLAGVIVEPDSDATAAFVEASRRLGSNWKLSVEARACMGYPDDDPASAFRKDDYLQVELACYF